MINSLINSLITSFINSFIYSFICSFIYFFILLRFANFVKPTTAEERGEMENNKGKKRVGETEGREKMMMDVIFVESLL